MGLHELALALVALALVGIYLASYRWLRGVLGDAPPEEVPAARPLRRSRHRGYHFEPRWVRPLQAMLLATGVTLSLVVVLGILAVATTMLLV